MAFILTFINYDCFFFLWQDIISGFILNLSCTFKAVQILLGNGTIFLLFLINN